MDVIAKKPGLYKGRHIPQNKPFTIEDDEFAPSWMAKTKPDAADEPATPPAAKTGKAKAKPDAAGE